jgi:hypothetical protein
MWWKRITFRNYFLASGVLILLTAVGILSIKSFLPPLIPLFYGKPSGAEQLAPTWFFFIIPGVSLLIAGVNLLVNTLAGDEVVKKILAVGTLVISIMAAVTVAKIILLVGFF